MQKKEDQIAKTKSTSTDIQTSLDFNILNNEMNKAHVRRKLGTCAVSLITWFFLYPCPTVIRLAHGLASCRGLMGNSVLSKLSALS